MLKEQRKECLKINDKRGNEIVYGDCGVSNYICCNDEIVVEKRIIEPPPPNDQSGTKMILPPSIPVRPKENKFMETASKLNIQILKEIPSSKYCGMYIVNNTQNHSEQVLKVYNIEILNKENVIQFKSIISAVNGLELPNIVKYEYISDNEEYLLYIMQKYVSSLEDINIKDYFKKNNKFDFLKDIYTGLNVLHSNNITHGNIKPSNILIDKDIHYYLSDYCKNILMKEEISENNILYLSPEVLENKELNISSDIWSIGCITYYILSNEKAFDGDNIGEKYNNIINCKYKQFGGDFSDEFNELIRMMLIKECEKRVGITELIDEIEQINYVNYCPMEKSYPLFTINDSLFELLERIKSNKPKVKELIKEMIHDKISKYNKEEMELLLETINCHFTSSLLYYPLYEIYSTVNKHFGENTTIIECNPNLQRWILFKTFKLNPTDKLKSMNKCPLTEIKDNEVIELKEYYKFKNPSDELILCYIIGKDKVLLNDKESQWNKFREVFVDIIEKVDELGGIEVIENIINKTLYLLKESLELMLRKPKENDKIPNKFLSEIKKIYDEFDKSMKDPTLKLNRFRGMDKYFEEYSSFYTEMKKVRDLIIKEEEMKKKKQQNLKNAKNLLKDINDNYSKDFEEEYKDNGIDDDEYNLIKNVKKIKEIKIDYSQIQDKDARLYLECSHFLYALEVANTVSAIVQFFELLIELEISKEKLLHDFKNFDMMKEPLEIYVNARINYYANKVDLNDYYSIIKESPFYLHKSITQEELDNAMNIFIRNDWIKHKIIKNEEEKIIDLSPIIEKCSVEYYEDKLDLQALKIIRYVKEENEKELDLHKLLTLEPYNYTSECEPGTIVSSSDLKYEYEIRNNYMKNHPFYYIYEGIYNSSLPFHDKLLLICPLLHNELSDIVTEILSDKSLKDFFGSNPELNSIDDIIPKADEYHQKEYKDEKPTSIQSKVFLHEICMYGRDKSKPFKPVNAIIITNIKDYELILPKDNCFKLPPLVKSRLKPIITFPIINSSNIKLSVESKKCNVRITQSSRLEIMIDNPQPPEMEIPIKISIPNKSVEIKVKFEVKEFDGVFKTNYPCGIDPDHPNRLIYTCGYDSSPFKIVWSDEKGKHVLENNRKNNSLLNIDDNFSVQYVYSLNEETDKYFIQENGEWKIFKENEESPVNELVSLPKDVFDVEETANQLLQKNSLSEYLKGIKNIYLLRLSNNESVSDKIDKIISCLNDIPDYITEDYLRSVKKLLKEQKKYLDYQKNALYWCEYYY